MQNKTIIIAAVAVIIATVAIAAGFVLMDSGSEYEKVQDTGQMMGPGSEFVYDGKVILDGETKKGDITIKVLGINPTGMLYSMEFDGSFGDSVNSGIILTNDMSSDDNEKVGLIEKEWVEIDTKFGKKQMSYEEYRQEGATNRVWQDQYTGISYKETSESDSYSMFMELKSMDVKWMSNKDDIQPSADLGRVWNYDITLNGDNVGEMTVTVVTNPDNDGTYYSRMLMSIMGQVQITYIQSGHDFDEVVPTGNTVTIETVDGFKELDEYRMPMDGVEALVYVDDSGLIYRYDISANGMSLYMDYIGTTHDRFWEEEEE